MNVALLTAGKDLHYALGLAPALAEAGIELEVVGNSEMANFAGIKHPNIHFLDLRGDQRSDASPFEKVRRILSYYARLLKFGGYSNSRIFHILWPNKFVHFDRTLLNLYYRAFGKKLIFTAHNVNTEARDKRDSLLNRVTLRVHYNLMHHVFVHTAEMRDELVRSYGVSHGKITILSFPINNVTPRTCITREKARHQLGIPATEKVILFFGNIAPYKGLEDLIRALASLRKELSVFRLLIAGNVKKGEENYLQRVRDLISELNVSDLVDERISFIPEDQVELYFKSADVLALPYRRIFQSGVLFLSYGFGLPVVATDAGSLRDEIIEGETGFVSMRDNVEDLARQICRYFQSDLFLELESRRSWIIDYANATYSWERLATKTREIYEEVAPR